MNKELAKYIKDLKEIDQDSRFNANNKFIVYCVDTSNEFRIKELVNKYGYPTKDLVGEEGLKDFWLLVQHIAFDTDFQQECLDKCNFGPMEYMHLYDRIKVNKSLSQKYGTQLNKPILNLEETNTARVEDGWISIEDWVEEFNSREDRKIELKKNDDGSAEYIR